MEVIGLELVLNTNHIDDGYEPRCSVCNSEFQIDIESMRENNKTFEEIRNLILTRGVKISLMALSRHFSKHYPQRKLYLEHVKNKQDKIDREVGLKIDEIFKINPDLDRYYFEDNSKFSRVDMEGNLEFMEKCNKEILMDDYGFCHHLQQLCPIIPARKAMYTEDIDLWYQNMNKEVPTSIKIRCIECKMNLQESIILSLVKIVSNTSNSELK